MQTLTLGNTQYVVLEKTKFDELILPKTDEIFPSDFVDRLFDGGSRLKAWREYRALTMQELAEAAEISQAYLSEIETGKKEGSLKVWKRLSAALNADLELLV